MSQQTIDVLRSLRYYLTQYLKAHDSDYDIRLAIEEDAFARPMGVVQTAGPAQMRNEGRRITTTIRPYAFYIYPPEGATVKEAELEVARVEGVIQQLFQVGGHGGHPSRIPLWDWDGLDDNDPLGNREPVAYATVADCNVDHRADSDDEKLQTVFANVRLSWRGPAQGEVLGPLIATQTVVPESVA